MCQRSNLKKTLSPAENFLHERLEARITPKRIEKWIGLDEGDVVTFLVSFLKKAILPQRF
jgi:hypothetical protein